MVPVAGEVFFNPQALAAVFWLLLLSSRGGYSLLRGERQMDRQKDREGLKTYEYNAHLTSSPVRSARNKFTAQRIDSILQSPFTQEENDNPTRGPHIAIPRCLSERTESVCVRVGVCVCKSLSGTSAPFNHSGGSVWSRRGRTSIEPQF